ncbi:MAG TPA: bifunctional (p)ppGpp synthetase/guanosine-3',5'-bis(diphosphate) 3'-pyrophosphohydrolase [Steroidobacteraceae bacterium]|nr:bifunctional (p)ppGpp synthetase/guanosine-3',5'-bis(diphosphate) 3'-pyrophosphohydrolase [Steroidobacteraceae bacterium]
METATPAPPEIAAQLDAARASLAESGADQTALEAGVEAARTVAALTHDADLALGTMLHRLRQAGLSREDPQIDVRLGAACIRVAVELERLGELHLPAGWTADQGLNAQQAEILRKMLLAVAADPRLVVAHLAGQLVQLRGARELSAPRRQRLALETREILAPLANRLGVWSLKWELEDLSFRYLEPEAYHRIARALAERRVDRERYIGEVCALLQRELRQAGVVAAAVYGRPKHIYSIWRKMQRKQLAFEQLFDVRAVRIVVASIEDCYAALGLVHALWRYIPGEFDDYIATPKDNEYRSIHTAVIGPEDKSLEVQIRSRDMDQYAELGVAAHWRYKEGGARDLGYERKIEWVRRVLDPAHAAQFEGDLIERVKDELFADRIYAMTPRGEVVDLPRGATPLDFAYQVHTGLGHRCRGAKIAGRIVPLNQPLANGDVVEIITGKQAAPSRDWLSPEPGFLVSPKSRAKVRAWFRRIDESQHRALGRETLERELARVGGGPELIAALVRELHADSAEDLQRRIGEGDIGTAALSQALTRLRAPAVAPLAPTRKRTGRAPAARSPVEIEGVGDLPTTIARCCGPVPPEPIAGYVTLGRGVTIHREGCPNLLRMQSLNARRVLRVEWNLESDSLLPVRIRVEALDRHGLLRDVSDVMALERLSIEGVNSDTDPNDRIATIVMRTAVRDSEQLGRVLQRLSAVPNVLRALRLA